MTYIINAKLKTGTPIYIKHPRSLNLNFARKRVSVLLEKRDCVCEIIAQGKGQAKVVWSSETVILN